MASGSLRGALGRKHKGTLSWAKLGATSLTAEVVWSASRLGQASSRHWPSLK